MRTAVRAQAPAVKRAGALTRPKVCTPRHSMRACSASFKRASGHARIRGRRQATGALVALDYPASLARIPHSGHAAPIQTFGLCRLFEMRGDVPLYNTNSCLFPPKLNKFVSWSSKRVLFLPKKVKNHTSEVVPGTWYSISVIGLNSQYHGISLSFFSSSPFFFWFVYSRLQRQTGGNGRREGDGEHDEQAFLRPGQGEAGVLKVTGVPAGRSGRLIASGRVPRRR